MRRRAVALLLALAAMPATGAAPAQATPQRASLPDIEDEVMCVTCNVPLNIAESPQASRQRAFIRAQIAQGLTKEQVKARLVDEYGDDVLALPQDDGIGVAAYAVPVATVLVMVAVVALLLPRWRRRDRAASPIAVAAPVSDAELRRLDEDLKRFD